MPGPVRILVLQVLPAIALAVMALYLACSARLRWPYLFFLSCLLGGGISNVMIDRIFNHGYVIDFMNIGIGNIRSGIFNFADLSIVLGSGAILFHAFKKQTGPGPDGSAAR